MPRVAHEFCARQFRCYAGLLGGNAKEIAYESLVLKAFKTATAIVPNLWFLEASNVIAKAESKLGVTEARSQLFISTLGQ